MNISTASATLEENTLSVFLSEGDIKASNRIFDQIEYKIKLRNNCSTFVSSSSVFNIFLRIFSYKAGCCCIFLSCQLLVFALLSRGSSHV